MTQPNQQRDVAGRDVCPASRHPDILPEAVNICPQCGSTYSWICKTTRYKSGTIRRKHKCKNCGKRVIRHQPPKGADGQHRPIRRDGKALPEAFNICPNSSCRSTNSVIYSTEQYTSHTRKRWHRCRDCGMRVERHQTLPDVDVR